MATKCPLCGEKSLVLKKGVYRFDPPPNIPGGTMVIPNMRWEECNSCKEVILDSKLCRAIDKEADRRNPAWRNVHETKII